jgi:hypothetical protein
VIVEFYKSTDSNIKNARENYSSAPAYFVLEPPVGGPYDRYLVEDLCVQVSDTNGDPSKFGDLIELTNGVQFFTCYKGSSGDLIGFRPITPVVKKASDWYRARAKVSTMQDSSQNTISLQAVIPIAFTIEVAKFDCVAYKVNDDLQGLTEHYITANVRPR